MYQWRDTKNVIQINLIHVYLHKLFIVYLSLRLIKTNGYVNLIWIQTQRHGHNHADIWTLFFFFIKIFYACVFVHLYSRWYPNANAAQGQCQVLTNEVQEALHDKMNCSCVNHDSVIQAQTRRFCSKSERDLVFECVWFVHLRTETRHIENKGKYNRCVW